MGGALLEAFRHSAWANRQLLDALSALTADQLAVSLPTGQGTPLVTMKHLVGAESYCLTLLRDRRWAGTGTRRGRRSRLSWLSSPMRWQRPGRNCF